jgi:hypothetical protein
MAAADLVAHCQHRRRDRSPKLGGDDRAQVDGDRRFMHG